MWWLLLWACTPDHGGPQGQWTIVESASHNGPVLPDDFGADVDHAASAVVVETPLGNFLGEQGFATSVTEFRFQVNEDRLSLQNCDGPRPGVLHALDACGWADFDPHFTQWDSEQGHSDQWAGAWFRPSDAMCRFGHKHATYSVDEDGTLEVQWVHVVSRYWTPVATEEDCFGEALSQAYIGPQEIFRADRWVAQRSVE